MDVVSSATSLRFRFWSSEMRAMASANSSAGPPLERERSDVGPTASCLEEYLTRSMRLPISPRARVTKRCSALPARRRFTGSLAGMVIRACSPLATS